MEQTLGKPVHAPVAQLLAFVQGFPTSNSVPLVHGMFESPNIPMNPVLQGPHVFAVLLHSFRFKTEHVILFVTKSAGRTQS
jgi:hypothetical protein